MFGQSSMALIPPFLSSDVLEDATETSGAVFAAALGCVIVYGIPQTLQCTATSSSENVENVLLAIFSDSRNRCRIVTVFLKRGSKIQARFN